MQPKNIKEDLKVLLDYLWHDEARHYSEAPRKDHIFLKLKRLASEIGYRPGV